MPEEIHANESPLMVFISSRMNEDLAHPRQLAIDTIKEMDYGRPWAFEFSPASSEPADKAYLRKVCEADFVIWLAGSETTPAVTDEITTAITYERRLLVFKLPLENRNKSTEDLLGYVSDYTKWKEVNAVEDLPAEIRQSLSDAIANALRSRVSPNRKARLQYEKRLSTSRCKTAWLALGVDDALADEMANQLELGSRLELPIPGLHTVVGDQGLGKSLAVERLFQVATMNAMQDSSQPFPVFIQARELKMTIKDSVEQSLQGNTDPFNPKIILIIDGIDEVGLQAGNDIYRQTNVYTQANDQAIVILTTRPIPGIQVTDDKTQLEPMTDEVSHALISRIMGRPLDWRVTYHWSESIREAARIPLFAVVIGALLRDNPQLQFASTGQMLQKMMDTTLGQASGNSEELDLLLQDLAVETIHHGSGVQPSVITTTRFRQDLLMNSRLIEKTNGTIDFALPVFRELYAAKALIEGTMPVEALQSASDRWLPVLSLVLNSDSSGVQNSMLNHLASSDPGLAGLILADYRDTRNGHEHHIPPQETSRTAGDKLRNAMTCWKSGLNTLYSTIGPVDSLGNVATIAVELDDSWITTAWYAGQLQLPPVVDIAATRKNHRNIFDWPSRRSSSVTRNENTSSWWQYLDTHEYLTESVDENLRNYKLTWDASDAFHEFVWLFAMDANHGYAHGTQGVFVDDTLEMMTSWRDAVTLVLGGRYYTADELEMISGHLMRLKERGVNVLHNPWPGADLAFRPGFVWSNYSDQRLLQRTTAVYLGALRIYEAIVKKWFQPFGNRLTLYHLMPCQIVGWLLTTDREVARREWPGLSWHRRALPKGKENRVNFELAHSHRDLLAKEAMLNEDVQKAIDVQSAETSGRFTFHCISSLSHVFSPCPATELAHDWLRADLHDLGWASPI